MQVLTLNHSSLGARTVSSTDEEWAAALENLRGLNPEDPRLPADLAELLRAVFHPRQRPSAERRIGRVESVVAAAAMLLYGTAALGFEPLSSDQLLASIERGLWHGALFLALFAVGSLLLTGASLVQERLDTRPTAARRRAFRAAQRLAARPFVLAVDDKIIVNVPALAWLRARAVELRAVRQDLERNPPALTERPGRSGEAQALAHQTLLEKIHQEEQAVGLARESMEMQVEAEIQRASQGQTPCDPGQLNPNLRRLSEHLDQLWADLRDIRRMGARFQLQHTMH